MIKSVSKRMLSLLLAMLMLCSGMAVASAAVVAENVPTPVYKVDYTKREITVDYIAPITVDGVTYDVEIDITPATLNRNVLKDNSVFYYSLEAGKTYTVKAVVKDASGKILVDKASTPVSFKNSSTKPAEPVISELTSTTIGIKNISDCEYKIEVAGKNEANWGSTTLFTGLKPDTAYDVYIRVKETDKVYASEAAKTTVKTLKTGKTEAPAAPELVDVEMTKIVVKEIDGILFSLDKEKWQASGIFSNLKAGQTYNVYAMEKYDSMEQDANPVSSPLKVVTNTKPRSPASLTDCTISVGDAEYTNSSVPISVKVKATYITKDAQYGDTIYIPVQYQVNKGEKKYFTDIQGTTFKASFVPGDANANKDVEVTIYYARMKFVGGTKDPWAADGFETSSTHKSSVGRVYNPFLVFFESIANFFLNTIPAYINEFLNSDKVSDFFEFFLGLGKNIDFEGLLGGIMGSVQ